MDNVIKDKKCSVHTYPICHYVPAWNQDFMIHCHTNMSLEYWMLHIPWKTISLALLTIFKKCTR